MYVCVCVYNVNLPLYNACAQTSHHAHSPRRKKRIPVIRRSFLSWPKRSRYTSGVSVDFRSARRPQRKCICFKV